MTTDSLYAAGWHQGSVLECQLVTHSAVRANNEIEGIVEKQQQHDIWIIATQDCNLDRTPAASNSPSVELRQVLNATPPDHWGIHARKFLLNDAAKHYLVDEKAAKFVSPRVLSDPVLTRRLYDLADERVLALKTWLGNRYDRPAVPDDLLPIARAVAEAVSSTDREIGRLVRDVYMEFEGNEESRTYSLYAVTVDGADEDLVREWLSTAALSVPKELGLLRNVEAAPASLTSLALIESAYCADLSQITWASGEGADGAF